MSLGKSVCLSSSFQTQSIPLLHIVSRSEKRIPILFIDTGFHFPETYHYINELVDLLDLNVVSVKPEISKLQQLNGPQGFYYNTEPDRCCEMNKVQPLDTALQDYDIWITGVRKDQTAHRKSLQEEERIGENLTKYHPMLEWTAQDIFRYISSYDLPKHPLYAKGYLSVGCVPCTRSVTDESGRDGRWYGSAKKECGIHLKKS